MVSNVNDMSRTSNFADRVDCFPIGGPAGPLLRSGRGFAAPRFNAIPSLPDMEFGRVERFEGPADLTARSETLEGVGHSVVGVEQGPFIITLLRSKVDLAIIEMDSGNPSQHFPGKARFAGPPVKRKPEIHEPLDRRIALGGRKLADQFSIKLLGIAERRRRDLPEVPSVMIDDQPSARSNHLPQSADAFF